MTFGMHRFAHSTFGLEADIHVGIMAQTRIGVIVHVPLRQQLFSPEDQARLNALGQVTWASSEKPLTIDEACGLLRDCEVGIGSWGTPYPNAQIMSSCPHLKLWEHAAGTVKHMFGPHLDGRSLTIASCAPAIAENVAQSAVAEVAIGVKRILQNAAANRTAQSPRTANSKNSSACTVGVVGASQVGRCAIRLLRAFECRILLYDPYINEQQARELGVRLVRDLDELCAASDAVTLHTPSLPSTHHIIGTRQLRAMRDDCVFVNTSRGDCVDEAALIEECSKGRLLVFLDVTSPEPAAIDSPLRKLPNVYLTSHFTGSGDFRLGRLAVDDVQAFLSGGRPRMVITRDMFDRVA